jgi:hypothetical protein
MSNELVDKILDEFDFETVKKTMDALEWPYYDSPDETVSIGELRRMARMLLDEVYDKPPSPEYTIGCGGFEAFRHMSVGDPTKYLSLKFVVTEWSADESK